MLKPDEYVGLHTHTQYSALDGFGTSDQIIPRIKELGQIGCGITDHGSTFGHIDFYTAMRAADLHPCLGIEFYHCRSVVKDKGKETGDKKKAAAESMSIPHLTVLARDLKGYRNLLKLYDLSWREGFYRKPRIDWDMLLHHSEGLTVLSGCHMSILSRMVRDGQAEEAHKYIAFLRNHMDFYVEIVPVPDFEESLPVVQTLWKIAQDLKVPIVITDDAHFPRPGDYRVQDAMLCINMGKMLDDPLRKIKLPAYLYRSTAQEVFERARAALPSVPPDEIATACRRSVEIARQCQVEIPHTTGPVFHIETKESPEGLLRRWIHEGKERRQDKSLVPEETDQHVGVYDARIAYELGVIESKQFTNYFLIVADLVRWMYDQKILAIARGSCGGSLICFYLGITQIDPIKWGLPFERFLNPERRDMPDIDIDIDSRHRDRVVEWVMDKYGRDRCAQIATLNEFGARQSLVDICKVCRIPDAVRDELKHLIPEGMEEGAGLKARGVLKRLFEKNPRAKDLLAKYPDLGLAVQLEGQMRQVSVHAAGVVIDKDPLIETVGIATHPKRIPLIACDKEHAASIGLLKIDLLKVDMVAVLAECMEDLKLQPYDVCSIPLDRPAVYEMLAQGRSMGVFQMQGGTTARVLQQLKPTDFNDLIALMALARPGPLESGGTNDYILRKHGRMEMPRYHQLITNCLRDTYGVIIYQEQVMQIMRDVGGMSWKQVHDVRKIIAKSGGAKKMEPYRGPYLEAAARQGVPIGEAEKVWTMCQEAGGYLFNKAHGAIYAEDAYWSAYLLVNHPAIYTFRFARYANDEKKRGIFRQFQASGGRFQMLDYKRSEIDFTVVDGNTILGGWSNIVGVGPVLAKEMVEKRHTFYSWKHAISQLPPNVADLLDRSGIDTGELNPDIILYLAPWYVQIDYLPIEKDVFKRLFCHTIATVHDWLAKAQRNSFCVVGRVLNAEVRGKKGAMHISVADETGTMDIWFSAKKWQEIMGTRNPMRGDTDGIGNSVLLMGSTAGDGSRCFGEDLHWVRTCQNVKPDAALRAKRRNMSDDERDQLRGLQQQLDMEEVTA